MKANGHQRDRFGEQFSELLSLEVAGIVTNNNFFLFLFIFFRYFKKNYLIPMQSQKLHMT
jgi:hypothetical protein